MANSVRIELPKKFKFLLEMHPYKVAFGGRNSLKSWSYARALLALGAAQKLRILCCREIQKSIKDSVHKLLSDQIDALGLGSFYQVLETEIRGANGTEFIFSGLAGHTAESIKSFEGIDVVWVEEAQRVTKHSWQILLPTVFRTKNSEVWVSFNPEMDTDDTWTRFIVHPPEGAIVVRVNYRDAIAAGWWTDEQEKLRLYDQIHSPDDYDTIWEGKCRSVVVGAIYARELLAMVEEGRIRPTPYDPKFPVHTIWDLGWNDAMSIIMVQKTAPSSLSVINYIEDSFRRYDEYVADMQALKYTWGTDWLPHDGENKNPQTGKSAKQILEGFGRKVKIITKTGPEPRIRAARMMFPRVYIDDTDRRRPTGYAGCARLIDCLKRYRRKIPKSTGEPAEPLDDEYVHAADAWGGLAEIVDRIRNENEIPAAVVPAYRNPEPSMGML
jgi:phage terminase large subunit